MCTNPMCIPAPEFGPWIQGKPNISPSGRVTLYHRMCSVSVNKHTYRPTQMQTHTHTHTHPAPSLLGPLHSTQERSRNLFCGDLELLLHHPRGPVPRGRSINPGMQRTITPIVNFPRNQELDISDTEKVTILGKTSQP